MCILGSPNTIFLLLVDVLEKVMHELGHLQHSVCIKPHADDMDVPRLTGHDVQCRVSMFFVVVDYAPRTGRSACSQVSGVAPVDRYVPPGHCHSS